MVEKRRLGKNGPELTTVGFGAWAAGGPWQYGWGPQDDKESIAAIHRALELGVNWIDTAAVYGWGHSEEVVGEALRGVDRASVYIATKCGRVKGADGLVTGDLRPETIRREVEDSLRRLKTDYIDLYQFHWPDTTTGTPVETSWETMARLQEEQKVRWIGVSNFDVPLMERCERIAHVDSLQPPYSLLRREVEAEILPWCQQNGTGVICYSPMQAGILSGTFDINRLAPDDWRRNSPYYQEPQLSRNLRFVEALRPIAARYGKTVGQLAIAWVLMHPAVTAAIVGARRPEQVEINVGAMGWTLTPDVMKEIEDAYAATE